MSYYQIKLYGSDTYIACDSNSETLESLLTSLSNVTIEVEALNPYFEKTGESYESPGGFASSDKTQRGTYKLRIKMFSFPSEYDDYYSIMQLLNHNYLWLKIIDYPIAIHTANYCTMVDVVGYSSSEEEGFIRLEVDLRKAKYE